MISVLDAPVATAPFGAISKLLQGELVVSNFGSSDDRGADLPAEIRRLVTLIEIDANAGSHIPDTHYGKIIRVRSGVAGARGRRDFYVSRYAGASSLLPYDRKLVGEYGMENFLETVEQRQVECLTVEDILGQNQIGRLDFLKTDLEGMDFAAIKSAGRFFDGVLAIQAELRFQPFFTGEPYFHEVAGYLAERGFELIGLKPEWWKYKTTHRTRQQKGRVVWADAVFFKNPASLLGRDVVPASLVRQIILAVMLRHENYAEFLLGEYRSHVPEDAARELDQLIAMRTSPRMEIVCPGFEHAAFE